MSSASSKPPAEAKSESQLPTDETIQRGRGVPWNPLTGLLVVIGIYGVSQIIASIIVGVYGTSIGIATDSLEAWLTSSTAAQFAYYCIVGSLSVGAVLLFVSRYGRAGRRSIGLRKPRWSDLGWALIGAPAYILLYLAAVLVIKLFVPGLDVEQEQELGFENVIGTAALAMTFVSLVVIPPLSEEIMVRGLMYSSLKKAMPVVFAAVLTSFLFASAHLPGGGASGPLYIAAIDTFALSLVLIYLRDKTDALWAPITLHALKNGLAFTILFIIK